jgi:dUTP pyrophosphatase
MSDQPSIFLKITAVSEELIPCYQTEGSAGADLMAFIDEDIVIDPSNWVTIRTGIFLEVPTGYEVQVRSRSGLACRYGVCVLNSPGTVDSDYRGEIKVVLINHGDTAFIVTPRMRIAQMVLSPVAQAHFVLTDELTQTIRGSNGFGHTGLEAQKPTSEPVLEDVVSCALQA